MSKKQRVLGHPLSLSVVHMRRPCIATILKQAFSFEPARVRFSSPVSRESPFETDSVSNKHHCSLETTTVRFPGRRRSTFRKLRNSEIVHDSSMGNVYEDAESHPK